MNPQQVWDAFAAQFGKDAAQSELGPRPPGVVAGTLRAMGDGATFGTLDKIQGATEAVGALVPGGRSPGEAYREGRDESQAKSDRFREDHPIMSLAGEFVGGVATGGVTGSAVRRMLPHGAAAAKGLRGLLT